MAWTIYWDNGSSACGTWGHLTFDNFEEAQDYSDAVTKEYVLEGIWDEGGYAEPVQVDTVSTPAPKEIEEIIEQSSEYFDRYIAGDR